MVTTAHTYTKLFFRLTQIANLEKRLLPDAVGGSSYVFDFTNLPRPNPARAEDGFNPRGTPRRGREGGSSLQRGASVDPVLRVGAKRRAFLSFYQLRPSSSLIIIIINQNPTHTQSAAAFIHENLTTASAPPTKRASK